MCRHTDRVRSWYTRRSVSCRRTQVRFPSAFLVYCKTLGSSPQLFSLLFWHVFIRFLCRFLTVFSQPPTSPWLPRHWGLWSSQPNIWPQHPLQPTILPRAWQRLSQGDYGVLWPLQQPLGGGKEHGGCHHDQQQVMLSMNDDPGFGFTENNLEHFLTFAGLLMIIWVCIMLMLLLPAGQTGAGRPVGRRWLRPSTPRCCPTCRSASPPAQATCTVIPFINISFDKII